MTNIKEINKKSGEIIFLSFLWTGFLPKAPGTWGSLATLPFLYFLGVYKVPFVIYLPFLFIATVGACFIAEVVQKKYDQHDPGWIVIDEVLGMFTTWLFFPTASFLNLFIIFILFRLFDIYKIWPATYFDKKMTHGAGTILDDIISGIYAGIVYLLIITYIPYFNS